jgi:hypothetical protein
MVAICRQVFLEGYITKDIKTKLGFLFNISFEKKSLKMAPIGDWNTQEDYDVSSVIIHISAYALVGFILVINHKSLVMNHLKLKKIYS